MRELLENYLWADGEIISLSLSLEYGSKGDLPTSQATVQLAIRKRVTATRWVPCQVRLWLQQIQRINLSEDFSSAAYSDIVLKQVEDGSWYLSLDPYGNSGEPQEQDNLVLVAGSLIIQEVP